MRLATIVLNSSETAAIVTEDGMIPVGMINKKFDTNWHENLFEILTSGQLDEMNHWYRSQRKDALGTLRDHAITFEEVDYAPLYRHPSKIWGIGLNYAEHAADLSERVPEKIAASFMKPDTTIIGFGDSIEIPVQSERTTGEAELGVIIGRRGKNVGRESWMSVVAGFTNIIDVTAEDILRKNPRYLTLAKSFDTFFSFGPHLITPDEVGDVRGLRVATVINGKVHALNSISNMTFPPDHLVSFHSKVMTLLPGDIISTGTPGAIRLHDGDRIACRIDGLTPLENAVKDLKQE